MINCLLMIVDNSCFCSSCRHTNELDELNSPSNTGNLIEYCCRLLYGVYLLRCSS